MIMPLIAMSPNPRPILSAVIDPGSLKAWDMKGRPVKSPLSPKFSALVKRSVNGTTPGTVNRILVVSFRHQDGSIWPAFPLSADYWGVSSGHTQGFEEIYDGNKNTGIFLVRVPKQKRMIDVSLQYEEEGQTTLIDVVFKKGKATVLKGKKYQVRAQKVPWGYTLEHTAEPHPAGLGEHPIGPGTAITHLALTDKRGVSLSVRRSAWDVQGGRLQSNGGSGTATLQSTVYLVQLARLARYRVDLYQSRVSAVPDVAMYPRT